MDTTYTKIIKLPYIFYINSRIFGMEIEERYLFNDENFIDGLPYKKISYSDLVLQVSNNSVKIIKDRYNDPKTATSILNGFEDYPVNKVITIEIYE